MINRILTQVLMFLGMAMPAILLLLLQFSSTLVKADQQADWYLQQLFDPTSAQLQLEVRGRVQIYAGLRDTDVTRAMDEQFDRIEYMFFTGTVLTDAAGVVLTDSETGAVLVENDGC